MGSHHLLQATFKLAVAIVEHILERSAPLRLWYVLTQKLIFDLLLLLNEEIQYQMLDRYLPSKKSMIGPIKMNVI